MRFCVAMIVRYNLKCIYLQSVAGDPTESGMRWVTVSTQSTDVDG